MGYFTRVYGNLLRALRQAQKTTTKVLVVCSLPCIKAERSRNFIPMGLRIAAILLVGIISVAVARAIRGPVPGVISQNISIIGNQNTTNQTATVPAPSSEITISGDTLDGSRNRFGPRKAPVSRYADRAVITLGRSAKLSLRTKLSSFVLASTIFFGSKFNRPDPQSVEIHGNDNTVVQIIIELSQGRSDWLEANQERISKLAQQLGVSYALISNFLAKINSDEVSRDRWPEALARVADDYRTFQQKAKLLEANDPVALDLVVAAKKAAMTPNLKPLTSYWSRLIDRRRKLRTSSMRHGGNVA